MQTFDVYDAQEVDRVRYFKERFLRCPDIILTGATVECSEGRVIVTDSAGNRGSLAYTSLAKRDAILAEIERGQRAEASGCRRAGRKVGDRPRQSRE